MKQLLVIALIGVLAWTAWNRPGGAAGSPGEPLHERPYLIVYGRDSCGYTQRTRRALSHAGVRFHYLSVDHAATADVLHERMRTQGIDTRRYYLPVVDLDNHIEVRPDDARLIRRARDLAL